MRAICLVCDLDMPSQWKGLQDNQCLRDKLNAQDVGKKPLVELPEEPNQHGVEEAELMRMEVLVGTFCYLGNLYRDSGWQKGPLVVSFDLMYPLQQNSSEREEYIYMSIYFICKCN